jgi:hypothetical protein
MDRDDARFVADALACRIAGDREELDRLAASSLMRLSTLAAVIRKGAAAWRPALVGASELMQICKRGANVVDVEPDPELQKLVDSLRRIADEPPAAVPNRAARRRTVANLPRAERRRVIIAGRPELELVTRGPGLIH